MELSDKLNQIFKLNAMVLKINHDQENADEQLEAYVGEATESIDEYHRHEFLKAARVLDIIGLQLQQVEMIADALRERAKQVADNMLKHDKVDESETCEQP